MSKNVKELGQFFTPEIVADFMINLSSINKNDNILEPSCGEGVFLKELEKKGFTNIDGFEVDTTLKNISNVEINYESFISKDFQKKYSLIIGNPPYIRWKNLKEELKEELINDNLWNKYFNSLCDYLYIFILKSIELLKDNGELIFITPEYWMHTTHSISLRNFMISNGYFEEIIHFSETPIFDGVNSSIIIFKFIKSKNKNSYIKLTEYNNRKRIDAEILNKIFNKEEISEVNYIDIPNFELDKKWILASDNIIKELKIFENHCISISDKNKFSTIEDIADVGNGMVSGLDKIFQINFSESLLTEKEKKSTINVLKAKSLDSFFHNDYIKYIFINEQISEEELINDYPNFYNQLIEEKEKLNKRYNYNRDIKYWEWVFLRNFKLFSTEKEKIFIPCKERISHKNFFRFSYSEIEFFPTQDVTAIYLKDNVKESIFYILALLNNHRTFNWIKFNGIIKGNIVEFSEKPINSIPIRLIDWNNKKEIDLHEKISLLTKEYIANKDKKVLNQIESLLDKLFI